MYQIIFKNSYEMLNSVKQCLHLTIRGAVQGVGFRPFVYRLAKEIGLLGWVNNSTEGVFIEVEGTQQQLETFLLRFKTENPTRSHIQNIEISWLKPKDFKTFEILPSTKGKKTAVVLPDLATCPDCLQEIFDPNNRRYRYPFTNCTNCGPRYSIIEALPYDRDRTTMKSFSMCPSCETEYKNPSDRRFHAQPNACPQCGPKIELWDGTGKILDRNYDAISATAAAIRQGKIVAVKGLGGFHLIVDARNEKAVNLLRQRKNRPEKPFALMYPNLELIKKDCQVLALEKKLLRSPEAPIVILKHKGKCSFAPTINDSIAPNNPYLGIMLPYTPLHHLLMAELGFAIVATSGNLANEPICIDEHEAIKRLKDIADLFLVHDRPITRPIDDSIAQIIMGEETIFRRARGYAPLPIVFEEKTSKAIAHRATTNRITTRVAPTNTIPILAVGAHLKNAIAIAINNQIFLSQHIGDLETSQAVDGFTKVIDIFQKLYDFEPEIIACDRHTDYFSSQYAQNTGKKVIPVQHHYAHVLACMAENHILGEKVLGVAWDGTGYGLDDTIWGGEFLLIPTMKTLNSTSGQQPFQRVAHLHPFPLPGGDRAVKEPRRSALGLLYEVFGDRLFTEKQFQPLLGSFCDRELSILSKILSQKINTPLTSSMGRLFDGIAAITNLCQIASFEGQAAMQLEFMLDRISTEESYPLIFQSNEIDWRSMLLDILDDIANKISVGIISVKFHNSLIEIVSIAQQMKVEKIVLTGGCFQNKYLIEKAIEKLRSAGFYPYWHHRIPPNDGGIALGQAIAAILETSS
jgi:hydrogenase maturation protein HypF